MLSRLLTTAALAGTALAQSYSACNPLKESGCPDNPAFEDSVTVDFTKGPGKVFTQMDGSYAVNRDTITYDPAAGAVLAIAKAKQYPTLISSKYIFFGRVDVEMRAAPGKGIVSSLVLQSDDRDEIDWEWVGYNASEVQSNYFGKGDDSDWTRGGRHGVAAAFDTAHTYSVDWTAERLQWLVDGRVVRTLTYAQAAGGSRYPQTPMQVRLGTWQAGYKGNSEGTIEWAGGLTDFGDGPFPAYVKSVRITNYGNGVRGASKYVWQGRSGSYESIKIVGGTPVKLAHKEGNRVEDEGDNGDDGEASSKSVQSEVATKTAKLPAVKTSSAEEEEETAKTSAASDAPAATTVATAVPSSASTASSAAFGPPSSTADPVSSAPKMAFTTVMGLLLADLFAFGFFHL